MSFARAFNGDDRIMEGQNDGGTECCKEPRERLNDRPSLELAHRHGKQAGEHSNEKEEENVLRTSEYRLRQNHANDNGAEPFHIEGPDLPEQAQLGIGVVLLKLL